jgi:hypothetical protein
MWHQRTLKYNAFMQHQTPLNYFYAAPAATETGRYYVALVHIEIWLLF